MKDFHKGSHYHELVNGLLFPFIHSVLRLCNSHYPVLAQVAGMIAKPGVMAEKHEAVSFLWSSLALGGSFLLVYSSG